MTLIEHYRATMARMTGREKILWRRLFNHTAQRYIHRHSLSTGQPPPRKPDADGVTVHEWQPFFDQFEPQEFVQLYEMSRPRKKG